MPPIDDEQLNTARYRMVPYHKYWLDDGSRNPQVDDHSRWLMDLKSPDNRNFHQAVRFFGERLERVACEMFGQRQRLQVAIVPSHTAGQCSQGLLEVAGYLNGSFDVTCSADFLYRFVTVPSLKEGGNRSQDTHLDSIEVRQAIDPLVRLLVIDDISTTGNSLLACRLLLQRAGARVVALMALGQTVLE